MFNALILTWGTLFYSRISLSLLLIADMTSESIDVKFGVLMCVVTAGDSVHRRQS